GDRLLAGRVALDGQRGARGEDFEEEWQTWTEARDGFVPQVPVRVRGDELVEATTVDERRRPGMGAHPQFGRRASIGLLAQDLRDAGRGAPRIVLHGVRQALH